MLKKALRFFLYAVLGIVLGAGAYLLLSQVLPFISVNSSAVRPDKGITIYIQSNGVHTDFVLPVRTAQINWNQSLPCSDFEEADSTFSYIALGWGDKGFFIGTPTWADLKFSTAFKAAFGLSSTAMHVAYRRYAPQTGTGCKKLVIGEEQYRQLTTYILRSFRTKDQHFCLINHRGYTSSDRFYEACGTYSLFKTCNVWTGNGLKAIGVRIGCWTPFQGGIMEHLE